MNKRILALFLSTCLCLSLCGCAQTPRIAEPSTEIVFPEPSPEAQRKLFGEQIASRPESVALHYVSGDGTSFSTIIRNLIISQGESLYNEAIDALLYNASSPDRMSFIPPEIQVLDTEYACGIVTVNLSLDAYAIQDEQEYLMLLASISNTLLSLNGVNGVNVLIRNRSEEIASLPTGAQTSPFSGITPTYAQFSAERDYFLKSETGTIVRNAVLYFPASNGGWFVPEVREITFDSSDYASALIRALRSGPIQYECAISAIPEGADLLVENPQMLITSAGERIVELNFASALRNYLAFSGIDEWDILGSVALTLCSFIPELDAVRLCIDGEPISRCSDGEREYTFEDGLVRRDVFAAFVGDVITLYLPSENGALTAVERATSPERASSPLNRLYLLLNDVLSQESSSKQFPSDIYYDDILGVSVENNTISVNLSSGFYRQAQMLDDTSERNVVYSIVNTLCELDGVTSVRFYVEGVTADTLAGNIFLQGALLPNPGIAFAEPDSTVITAKE